MIGFFNLKGLLIFLIINIIFLPSGSPNSKNYNPVASIVNLEGIVKIQTKESQKFKYAREGMMLFNENKIIKCLKIICNDKSILKIGHNIKYDLRVLDKYDV